MGIAVLVCATTVIVPSVALVIIATVETVTISSFVETTTIKRGAATEGAMTTEISYVNDKIVAVRCVDLNIFCMVAECREVNRRHEGVWNSRVLAFVPQYPPAPEPFSATFSDGTPVSSYEQFN